MTGAKLDRRSFGAAMIGAAAIPMLAPTALAAAETSRPLQGASRPAFWRYKIGGFEITVVSDAAIVRDGPYPTIGKNASEAEVRDLMRQNLLPETRFEANFTPAIVGTGKENILFDTGNGANGFVKRPDGGRLAATLAPAGFKPEDIDIVVITHGHGDHVGGLMEDGKPAFPNARYVTGAKEFDFWNSDKLSGDIEKAAAPFRANAAPLKDKFTFLKPGDDVVTGVRAVEAFGHTPGHLAFMIENNGRQILLWADCAHHHVASLARPDWTCAFDVESEAAVKTRKTIFDMAATDRLPVIGYHMPFPSVGFVEKRDTAGYRWVPHTFQLSDG